MFWVSGLFARRFAQAASAGGASNIHLFQVNDRLLLVAYEEKGRMVAVDSSSFAARLLLAGVFVFGVVTIPFFGAGLVILFLWWGLFKKSRPSAWLDRYVRSLPATERIRG